jgi:CDP-diacylglycerol--glycerol-3-phosphate 3-phosphatidyltransferase
MSGETPTAGVRLRVEWALTALAALALVAVGRELVGSAVGDAAAGRWVLVAGAVLAYELWFLRRHLARNAEPDGPLRESLGPANALTVVRGGLYAAAGGFLLVPPTAGVRWVPGLCYGVGAVLDFVDGWVARRTDRQSVLGARLDLAFDTLGFLVVPLVAVAWGRLPAWYLALGLARYCFRAGEAYRRYRGRPVGSLPESRVRRPLAALQMGVITAALLPTLPTRVTVPLATAAMAPSLLVFGRDWLVVSGRLDAGGDDDGEGTAGVPPLPAGRER